MPALLALRNVQLAEDVKVQPGDVLQYRPAVEDGGFILTDREGTEHFFYPKGEGMFYDGWGRECSAEEASRLLESWGRLGGRRRRRRREETSRASLPAEGPMIPPWPAGYKRKKQRKKDWVITTQEQPMKKDPKKEGWGRPGQRPMQEANLTPQQKLNKMRDWLFNDKVPQRAHWFGRQRSTLVRLVAC